MALNIWLRIMIWFMNAFKHLLWTRRIKLTSPLCRLIWGLSIVPVLNPIPNFCVLLVPLRIDTCIIVYITIKLPKYHFSLHSSNNQNVYITFSICGDIVMYVWIIIISTDYLRQGRSGITKCTDYRSVFNLKNVKRF